MNTIKSQSSEAKARYRLLRHCIVIIIIIIVKRVQVQGSSSSTSLLTNLIEEQKIEISPLGFMRGRTFKNCWIVADEMQNSTISQMKMLLTRIGENTRLVITGDCEQIKRYLP